MALPEMTDALQALNILDPEYLLFCPSSEDSWLQDKFDDIPRYLFRVFTPNSRGTTDESWARSMDAKDAAPNSKVDIFARKDKERVASMLNRHLRWWEGLEDNLVSWTSSLLFALVYIFHLHANLKDRSAFDDIYLCIIDTNKFPKAVFLRDMDLIKAYSSFNKELASFEGLRLKKDWYFGEYLSQGALKIEDKCQIVLAQAMIDRGLYDLRHEFEEFSRWGISKKPPWAKPVVELRGDLYWIDRSEKNDGKLRIILDIAQVFGSRWKLPMAANLRALLPPSEEHITIVRAFKKANFLTDDDRENSSPLKTKVRAYNSLPEVEQFSNIMQEVYKDFCVEKLRKHIGEAQIQLRYAVTFTMNQNLPCQDLDLLDLVNKAVKVRIDEVAAVNEELREMIGRKRVEHDSSVID